MALPFTFKTPIERFFLLNLRDGAEVAFQKKKAITRVMAFSISVGLKRYGRFGLSSASCMAMPVMIAVTPTAVIRK
jgi:hypothetical protein